MTYAVPPTERTEADAIGELGRLSAEPHVLETGRVHAVPTPTGLEIVHLDGDDYRDVPRRKEGTVKVDDLPSFLAYYGKHADEGTETYVNVDQHYLTAVLDAHTPTGPRWGRHRLILALKTTDRWKAWMRHDRRPLTQMEWAEFVEDHLDDIREPAAAEMLEIAQTFQAQQKVRFVSNHRLSSGQCTLNWEETVDAKAGEAGRLTVPTDFKIGVAPFDFTTAYGLSARFRYRIAGGNLTVQYLLDDPMVVIRDAVLDVVAKVKEELGVTVLRGVPAGS